MKKYNRNIVGILSDVDIRQFFGEGNGIHIYTDSKDGPKFDLDSQLHVCSVDLHFRHDCKRFKLDSEDTVLSYELIKAHRYTESFELASDQKLRIAPGEVILTTTLEVIHISQDFAAIITGRSSIARLGVMVHCCQEFIHPGNRSAIGLQIVNLSPYPVELDLQTEICQVIFFKLATTASEGYAKMPGAKYSGETTVKESGIASELEKKGPDSTKGNRRSFLSGLKPVLAKYFGPFLPALIMALIITPIITSKVSSWNFTIGTVSVSVILGVLCILIYIFIKKDN